MTRTTRLASFLGAVGLIALAASPMAARLQQRATYEKSLWAGLRYRTIGPSRGGRVTTVTGVPSQPRTF